MREIKLNSECNYVHLLSGGLDSAYSLVKLAKLLSEEKLTFVIHPIFFDYGQSVAHFEWRQVGELVKYIRNFLNHNPVIDDPVKISLKSDLFQWCESDSFRGAKGRKTPEIENRNMVLFSVLASYLIACANHQGITSTKFEISSGFKEGELKDCNKVFFEQIAKLLHTYKGNLTFNIGILHYMNRGEVSEQIKSLLGISYDEFEKFLELTTSCYSPNDDGKPCGVCSKCVHLREKERAEKEINNKIEKRFST